MALQLGIEIGAERTVAAVARDGDLTVVRLGREAGVPTVAHVGADGTVETGDAAVARGAADTAGTVPDLLSRVGDPAAFVVNGRAVDGEVLVAHLLSDVVETVVARHGAQPDEVCLVHPDGWDDERVEALRAAATRAGLTVSTTSASAAREHLRRERVAADDDTHSLAVGAALAAAHGADPGLTGQYPPIVTREDLEGPVPPPPARPVPTYEVTGPTSVFVDDAPPPGADRTTAMPVYPPIPPAGPRYGDGDDDDGSRGRWLWALAAAIAAVVLVLALILLLSGDDGDDVDTGTSTTVTTTVATTTVPETSTTETTAPTTTVATTTTAAPTTTAGPTTTTVPAPPPQPVAVSDFGLELRPGAPNSEDVVFGTDADTVVNLIRGLLGAPDDDTGWGEDDECEGDATRRVRWDRLEIVLTQEGDDGDPDRERTFTQWFLDDEGDEPPGFLTPERVGIGATNQRMRQVYGDRFELEVGEGGRGHFVIEGPDGDLIEGVSSGIDPGDTVIRMWAGTSCEREL